MRNKTRNKPNPTTTIGGGSLRSLSYAWPKLRSDDKDAHKATHPCANQRINQQSGVPIGRSPAQARQNQNTNHQNTLARAASSSGQKARLLCGEQDEKEAGADRAEGRRPHAHGGQNLWGQTTRHLIAGHCPRRRSVTKQARLHHANWRLSANS